MWLREWIVLLPLFNGRGWLLCRREMRFVSVLEGDWFCALKQVSDNGKKGMT